MTNVLSLSPRTVNETRGQFTNSNLQALPTDPIGPAVSIAGAHVTGTFTLAAGGAISQTGAIQTAALDLSTSSGAIVLQNAGNAFDVLTSTSPYRAGGTVQDALVQVRNGAGTQFDPDCAEALLRLEPRLEEFFRPHSVAPTSEKRSFSLLRN